MKNTIYASLLLIASTGHAQAQSTDIVGGSGFDSAQTVHHCGYLPTEGGDYTSTPLTATLVQKKLSAQGYYHGAFDGKFGPLSQAATRAFQLDYNLPVTGRVDGETAARLAYATHPSVNVQRCYRPASNYFR